MTQLRGGVGHRAHLAVRGGPRQVLHPAVRGDHQLLRRNPVEGPAHPAGHHVHKDGDPRTPRLFEIAREEGRFGPHLALFEAIGRVHPQVLGRTLPLNGAGVCGAALADLGLPLPLLRGFALLARTAGLIGQLAEELRHPVGNDIFLSVDLNNQPVDPDPLPM